MTTCSLPFFNGYLNLTIRDDTIIASELSAQGRYELPESAGKNHPLVETARTQVAEYLLHQRREFDLPFASRGTEFQNRVWDYLLSLPAGKTVSYGHAAHCLHTSPRAVGGACRNNPLAVFVPCHRIIAADGIGGYAGDWQQGRAVTQKQQLLEHERYWLKETA